MRAAHPTLLRALFACAVCACALLSLPAHAQDDGATADAPATDDAAEAPEASASQSAAEAEEAPYAFGPHSLNLSVFGGWINNYALNYEHLFARTHGLIVESTFSISSDDVTSSLEGGGSLGYRWHWSGSQDSGFLGAAVGVEAGNSETRVSEDSEETTFDVDSLTIYAGVNVGRRWAWDSGFNITLRGGAGYANRSFSTDDDSEGAQLAVEAVESLLALFPVYIDAEASVGWIF